MTTRLALVLVACILAWPAQTMADLTAKWTCDDGGVYYLRQLENAVYWYGEENATHPRWSNVFVGRIRGQRISGNWTDVPKGQTQGQGEMQLAIQQNGNVLQAVKKTGGFGGSTWKRMGYQPPAATIKEDCV
ncbi:MAG: hypothetical protein JSW39_12325, partial [Desulfobacterales bacterium]